MGALCWAGRPHSDSAAVVLSQPLPSPAPSPSVKGRSTLTLWKSLETKAQQNLVAEGRESQARASSFVFLPIVLSQRQAEPLGSRDLHVVDRQL